MEILKMRIRSLGSLIFGAVIGTVALASPITYTMTATASGSVGGTAFSNAAITVTSGADTNNVFIAGGTSPDFIYEIIPPSSSISIAGFGSATFTDPMFW